MTKTMKIFLILFITFSFVLNIQGIVFATDVNINLIDDTDSNIIDDEANIIDDTSSDISDFTSSAPDSSQADTDILSPTGVNNIEDEGLSLANILSILLIAVGIVLIFLSIAIILRLR